MQQYTDALEFYMDIIAPNNVDKSFVVPAWAVVFAEQYAEHRASPPPSSHQGDFIRDMEAEVSKRYSDPESEFAQDFEIGASWAKEYLSQPAPPTPVEGPTPTAWKEIEEELIECYEDYPAMNAEQDARKKIDEWKAKSQQELQGRNGLRWVNTFKGDDKGWQLCRVIGSDKRMPMLITQNLVCDPAGKTYKHDEIEYLSDSPAPEQVDLWQTIDKINNSLNFDAVVVKYDNGEFGMWNSDDKPFALMTHFIDLSIK